MIVNGIHKYIICERCHGTGRIVCPQCKGAISKIDHCQCCKEKGLIDCLYCGGETYVRTHDAEFSDGSYDFDFH